MKIRRKWWFFQILICITILLIFIYTWRPAFGNNSIYQVVENRLRHTSHYKTVKTILYWNTMYAEKHRHFMFGVGDRFKNCPVSYCYATPNRLFFNSTTEFDAILFHGIELQLNDLPITRSVNQRFIFFSWESPRSRPINKVEFVIQPDFYNWTMSYRLDSDIIRPYGLIRDRLTNKLVTPPKGPNTLVKWRDVNKSYNGSMEEHIIIEGKKKIAAWFVSHCTTVSEREVLVKELQQYFKIDVYGKCGDLQCDKENFEECYNLLERDYFFYLSFENTLCADYVTEKLFLPMTKYIIPVVYGGADYLKFAPPHSYIDVRDFKNLKELAKYLLRLSINPAEYITYFWWKKYYTVEDSTENTLCDLCKKLHRFNLPRKSLSDFKKYYNEGECMNNGNAIIYTTDEISNDLY